MPGVLLFKTGCLCAGSGCGGHVRLPGETLKLDFTPIGWQGAAQHTWTRGCDGFHEPGSCPSPQQPVCAEFGG